jgi:hypothetical protein
MEKKGGHIRVAMVCPDEMVRAAAEWQILLTETFHAASALREGVLVVMPGRERPD